jgi:hypothetical protein
MKIPRFRDDAGIAGVAMPGRHAIRTLSSPTAVTIHSVFDSEGRRIAEYDEPSGALLREYAWLGWNPIAVIESGTISFVRADHIGRPVFATNAGRHKSLVRHLLPGPRKDARAFVGKTVHRTVCLFPLTPSAASTPLLAPCPPPASPANGSNPNLAFTRIGCGITTRQQGGIFCLASKESPTGSIPPAASSVAK